MFRVSSDGFGAQRFRVEAWALQDGSFSFGVQGLRWGGGGLGFWVQRRVGIRVDSCWFRFRGSGS